MLGFETIVLVSCVSGMSNLELVNFKDTRSQKWYDYS